MSECHPINYALLRRLVPHYHAPKGYDLGYAQEQNLLLLAIYLDPILTQWGITTLLRKAHFLGQSAEETNDFTSFYESRLDGQAIDGHHYEGRLDLGNTHPGDGARYIGRGGIQVTGRANYRSAAADVDAFRNSTANISAPSMLGTACQGADVGFEDHPERLAEFPYVVESACSFWVHHGLNALADQDDVVAVTVRDQPRAAGLRQASREYQPRQESAGGTLHPRSDSSRISAWSASHRQSGRSAWMRRLFSER